MYERSAIVLERYLEKILNFNKKYNLKDNYKNYNNVIEEIEKYQYITTKEGTIIQEFDKMAEEIQNIQKKQEKISHANQNLEEERTKLFSDLGENSSLLETKLNKIESSIDKNNEELKELKELFVKYLRDFTERQKERNKCEKARRIGEASHIEYIKKMKDEFKEIDSKDILNLKDFINADKDAIREDIKELMIKNGKNERIKFDDEVIKRAIRVRMSIAEREAECYILIYDRMRKILSEIENDNIKLEKYKKVQKNVSVKLEFLNAEKEYIAGFLDYERMTAISGAKVHTKMMEEACNNFELDIIQIDKLYDLVMLETSNKSTKKAYKELYNKTYLKNIEDKEKHFEKEVNNIKINMATVINSNYWRIEGIKNIYNVFQYEITTKFDRDLSEYRIEEEKEEIHEELIQEEDIDDEIAKYIDELDDEYEEDEYSDDDEEDDDDDFFDEEDFEDYEENEEYDEYENEEYDEDEEYDEELEEEEDYLIQRNKKSNNKNQSYRKYMMIEEEKKENNIFNKFFKDRRSKRK